MYRITVDTGGTFTDVVLSDDNGNMVVGKSPTTPARAFDGVKSAIGDASRQLGMESEEVIAKAELLIYATTRATNAILEGTTAKTALLTTEGFPETLVLREGGKFKPFDFTQPYPEPYIPRRLTFEVEERMDSRGKVVTPLDEGKAREIIDGLKQRDVEAVAVAFIWSIVNPDHELRVAELLQEEMPGVPFTLSHQLNPVLREYRRTSSAAIDSSLKPLMQAHLDAMESDLREAGFVGELLAATSSGGLLHVSDLVARPIYSVRSGPALAPIAAVEYAERDTGQNNVIVCDTGGTSFDVSLVRDGETKMTRETWLGEQFTGHLTGLSAVDVRSIGAGGGSIAWIDSGGLLRVGPASAGAVPGPACYGRGGDKPTVTDAAVTIGYLNPDYFLGGEMKLDAEAAQRVMSQLAEELGESVEDTANAVLAVANEHMVNAIHEITVNEGVDPRDGIVVAGGGAAGMNIIPIVRELGCREALVPRTAGALSACGAQFSDIVSEFTASCIVSTSDFPYEQVNQSLGEIQAAVEEFAEVLRGRGIADFRTSWSVEARYFQQVWDLEIPLQKSSFEDAADVEQMIQAFHDKHEQIFAVHEPGQSLELSVWRATVRGELGSPPLEKTSPKKASRADVNQRQVYFSETGWTDADTYAGTAMVPGMKVEGPAIIEEPTTTLVVYPGSRATVTELNNYHLEID